MRAGPRRRRTGFTLAELLAVLALTVVLAALAAPGMAAMLRRQRLLTTVDAFAAALDLARSEAVTGARRIDVAARGAGWESGWTVFEDRDGDGLPGAGDRIVAVYPPVAPGLRIAARLTDGRAPPYIAYNGGGRTRTDAGGPQFGTLAFMLGGDERRIKINFLGRARSCEPARDPAC